MAVRVTSEEVLAILGDVTEWDFSLTPFITSANALVNYQLSGAALSEALLKEIEMWTAAHLATVRNPLVRSEEMGAASTSYVRSKEGYGLMSTIYGQTAINLDTTGTLANIDKGRVSLKHLG